ncbi:hypothetical protein [Pseudescherichia vulneris]|uniref:hypothetical protein n=1 Tax=Pseudescherichia vulneris TaxID=566 RepID=UPI001EE063B3|nr:hypothetical protein [Pseudescherichia vulneris]
MSASLSPEEQSLINEMGCFWKPRCKYVSFSWSREPEKYEALGFLSQHHYQGYCHFSQLDNAQYSGFEIDYLFNDIEGGE